MAAKVGHLIKEARTNAGLTQEKLAKKSGCGLTASDIGKAERGELSLSTVALRKIATATGVTQSSLVNAAKGTSKPVSTKKAASATPTNAGISMRVTSTEKKLIEYYRKADSNTKKAATNVLKGAGGGDLISILGGSVSSTKKTDNPVADIISDALGNLLGGK